MQPNLAKAFAEEHPEVEVINKAVSTFDGTITMAFGMAHVVDESAPDGHVVPTIDFARFLQDRFTPADLVVAKIDVEGTEMDLFEHLIATDALALIDEVFVEWHTWRDPAIASRQSAILRVLHKRGINFHMWK